jgi:hypothetical protein
MTEALRLNAAHSHLVAILKNHPMRSARPRDDAGDGVDVRERGAAQPDEFGRIQPRSRSLSR